MHKDENQSILGVKKKCCTSIRIWIWVNWTNRQEV